VTVFVALNGPNDNGKKPKAPSVRGWESPGYKGINPKTYTGWYGLRCDGLIVIDCDHEDARQAWSEIDPKWRETWVRKTPRGFHIVYLWHDPLGEIAHLKGPHAGVLPGIDIRQGPSSQIVYSAPGLAPGYGTLHGGPATVQPFHPPWAADFKLSKRTDLNSDTWDEMPEGIGNNTMAALAGTMRKQGMSVYTMARCLQAINKITMTTDPMPKEMLLDICRSVSRYEVDPFVNEIAYVDD
jgi:hypothetical protein